MYNAYCGVVDVKPCIDPYCCGEMISIGTTYIANIDNVIDIWRCYKCYKLIEKTTLEILDRQIKRKIEEPVSMYNLIENQ